MILEEQINSLKDRLTIIRNQKMKFVKSQKFEEVATKRDEEHRLQIELQILEKEQREGDKL